MAEFTMPFDVVTNEELCGVPHIGKPLRYVNSNKIRHKARSKTYSSTTFVILRSYVSGQMQDNYVDFNAAKIYCLRNIVNAPI